MRVRNKELRQRRHRKEQHVKDVVRELKAAGKPEKPKAEKPKAEKPVKAAKPAADKPKKAPAKKKADAEASE